MAEISVKSLALEWLLGSTADVGGQIGHLWKIIRVWFVVPLLRVSLYICLVLSTMLFLEWVYIGGVLLFFKKRPEKRYIWEAMVDDSEIGNLGFPMVLVQIPLFNEKEVYKLSIGAACNLSWPADRILIQVMDGSTDTVIKDMVEKECARWASEGVNIRYQVRETRGGFKAGALKEGLTYDYVKDCEHVAIFDADFQPEPDFLRRAVPFLVHNPNVALVQARWRFVNADECLLTRLQEISMDYHFTAEQEVGSSAHAFFGFNVGIQRPATILNMPSRHHFGFEAMSDDTAQIRQQIDLLAKQVHIVRIQYEEIKRFIENRFLGNCEFAYDVVPIQFTALETYSMDMDALSYGEVEDSGYNGPPIFDEEIDNTMMEVGYDEPPKFDEEIGGYNGPPIFDTEGDDTISMVNYENPPKFDEDARGYDGPPIFANDIENCHTHGVMQHDLKPEFFLFNTKKEISSFKDINFGLSIFFKPMERFIEIVEIPYYMAPGVLKRSYEQEMDCFVFDLAQICFDIHLVFPSRPPRAPPWFDNSLISLPIRGRIVSTPERMMEILIKI